RVAPAYADPDHGPRSRLAELRDQHRNVRGVVLKVRVERDDDPTAGQAEARVEAGALSGVALEVDRADLRRRLRHPVDDLPAAVRGAVVDQQRLVPPARRHERAAYLLPERAEVVLLVEDGDDEGDLGGHGVTSGRPVTSAGAPP